MQEVQDWMREHHQTVWLIGISMGVGLIAMIGGLIAIVYMPPDALQEHHRPRRPALRIARNIVGWVLVVAGLAMLALPGPGLVALLFGVMLAEFPGRERVKRWLLTREHVMGPANRLRKRFGRKPLKVDAGGGR